MKAVKELFQINDAVKLLQAKYDEGDIDEQSLKDTVDSITFDVDHNLESLANWYKNVDADLAAFEKEKKLMTDKIRTARNTEEFIKDLANKTLQSIDVKKYTAGVNTFSIRNYKKVKITNESEIPANYWKTQDPKLDKAKITKELRADHPVSGAELEASRSVTIK